MAELNYFLLLEFHLCNHGRNLSEIHRIIISSNAGLIDNCKYALESSTHQMMLLSQSCVICMKQNSCLALITADILSDIVKELQRLTCM